MMETPATLTYTSIVSRDSVHIYLTIAALNGLDILSWDVHNAYLTADLREKIWTRAGMDFGSEAGMITIFRKALYGLKSSGAAFYANLAETLNGIGLMSTKAEPDVWYFPVVKPNGLSTMSTSCVTSMIYCVYHTTWALHSDKYRPSLNSKAII